MTLAIVLFVIAVIFIYRAIQVVPQQNAWVVERLGKYHRTLPPGPNFILPFIDKVAYKHSLKEIPLSEPVRAMLGIEAETIDPDSLITAILKAEVDLLWFGGIGTYVKAAHENNVEVGDPAHGGRLVEPEHQLGTLQAGDLLDDPARLGRRRRHARRLEVAHRLGQQLTPADRAVVLAVVLAHESSVSRRVCSSCTSASLTSSSSPASTLSSL